MSMTPGEIAALDALIDAAAAHRVKASSGERLADAMFVTWRLEQQAVNYVRMLTEARVAERQAAVMVTL